MNTSDYPIAYILTYGGGSEPETKLSFTSVESNDVATRFSEAVTRLNGDDSISAAYAAVNGIDGVTRLAWTKMSNERPTADGRPL